MKDAPGEPFKQLVSQVGGRAAGQPGTAATVPRPVGAACASCYAPPGEPGTQPRELLSGFVVAEMLVSTPGSDGQLPGQAGQSLCQVRQAPRRAWETIVAAIHDQSPDNSDYPSGALFTAGQPHFL